MGSAERKKYFFSGRPQGRNSLKDVWVIQSYRACLNSNIGHYYYYRQCFIQKQIVAFRPNYMLIYNLQFYYDLQIHIALKYCTPY